MIHLWCYSTARALPFDDHQQKIPAEFISTLKIAIINQARSDHDSNALRTQVLTQYLANSETPSIQLNHHGKPTLANMPQLEFNVTHTPNYWFMAVTLQQSIGIDCEYTHRSIKNRQGLQWKISSNNDFFTHQTSFDPLLAEWVFKESVIKCLGGHFGMQKQIRAKPISFEVEFTNKHESGYWKLFTWPQSILLGLATSHYPITQIRGIWLDKPHHDSTSYL